MPQNNEMIRQIFESDDTALLQGRDLHAQLAAYLNQLILTNFDELIYLLYRVDVSEHKLKTLLKENDQSDAGGIIASLMIERQVQKIISRREHRRDNNIIDSEEAW